MKSCEYYEELISRSLDDALNVEERKELAVHLASCPSCSCHSLKASLICSLVSMFSWSLAVSLSCSSVSANTV